MYSLCPFDVSAMRAYWLIFLDRPRHCASPEDVTLAATTEHSEEHEEGEAEDHTHSTNESGETTTEETTTEEASGESMCHLHCLFFGHCERRLTDHPRLGFHGSDLKRASDARRGGGCRVLLLISPGVQWSSMRFAHLLSEV